jgi:hypothetical protein
VPGDWSSGWPVALVAGLEGYRTVIADDSSWPCYIASRWCKLDWDRSSGLELARPGHGR